MQDKKRLLLVTSRFPYPPIGGDRLRVFHMARLLARDHEVELLSLDTGRMDDETVAAFCRASGVARATSFQHSRWRAWAGAARALIAGRPLQVGYFHSPRLQAAFDEALERSDLAVMHLIRTSALWHRQRDVPALLDMCDAISENLVQVVRHGKPWSPWTWVCRVEAPRLRQFELAQAARFDLVSFVAAADRDLLALHEPHAFVVTQGVDLPTYPYRPPAHRQGNKLALIGKMDTYPNRTAALWLVRELMPLLPGLRLKLVGDCPPALREQLMAYPGVEVTGRVESIAQACDDCVMSLAPMDVATGIQNKVLESFALGLPVVLSASVAQGLLPDSAGCYRLADTPQEWVTAIEDLRRDPQASTAMADKARDYVERHHCWDAIGADLTARLQRVQSSARPSGADATD